MKERFINLFIVVTSCVLSFSCGKPAVVRELVQAGDLMPTKPDTALALLESIPFPETLNSADYACYCLLLTEAQDKTYYRFTSDSIIRVALDYYEKTKDKQKLPKAYYYMGRVCHTLYNAPQAINYYLKARDILEKDTDYALEARIYNHLGALYVTLRFNDDAAIAYQKAYESLSLAGDSLNLSFILRDMARVYDASDKRDSAIFYYNKAIASAMEVGNRNCELSSRIEQVSVFLRENRLAEAKEQKDRVVNLYGDNTYTPQSLLISGKFFDSVGQLDSARYYFNQSILTDNLYTRASSIRELALLEEKEQNYKAAVLYNRQYNAYRDSIEKMMSRSAVSDMDHFYNYQQIENENNRLRVESGRKELMHSRIFFSIAIVVIISVGYFFYYRQKKRKEVLIKEKELLYKEELYRKSKEKIHTNLQEIAALQKKIETNSGQLDEVSQELIRTKSGLLEQQNKQIELSIHHLSLQREKLMASLIYKKVKGLLSADKILSELGWLQLKDEMDTIYETFLNKLNALHPSMSKIEQRVCYLLKAGFSVSEIAILLGRQKSSITSCRKRLYEKIKGVPGSAEALDRIIDNLD